MLLPSYVVNVREYRDFLCRSNYEIYEPLDLPCGQCKACRLALASDWTNRLVMEYETSDNALFITWTYDDDHLPKSSLGFPTLDFSHIRKLNQDMTNHFLRDFGWPSPRHYIAGEYGTLSERPHYHSIHYNMPIKYLGLRHYKSYRGNEYLISDYLTNLWGRGFVVVGSFSVESAGYVSRYVTKKLTGQLNADRLLKTGRVQESTRQSNRPGIGYDWLMLHKDDINSLDCVLPGRHKQPLPRYILDKFEDLEIIDVASLKVERSTIKQEALLYSLDVHHMSMEDYLLGQKQRFESIIKKLPRKGV